MAKLQDLEQDRNADQEIIEFLEEKLKEAEGNCEKVQSLKGQVETLTESNKEQEKLLSELRFELAQSEDLKDELEAKTKEISELKGKNAQLESMTLEHQSIGNKYSSFLKVLGKTH